MHSFVGSGNKSGTLRHITKVESIKIGNEIDFGKRIRKRKNLVFHGIVEENSNINNIWQYRSSFRFHGKDTESLVRNAKCKVCRKVHYTGHLLFCLQQRSCFHPNPEPVLPPVLSFFFFNKFIYLFICLFIYYLWLHWVFVAVRRLSLVAASGGYSLLRCASFSLRLLLLLRSTGARRAGFSSCATWFSSCASQALERRLSSCVARACGMWDLPGPGLKPVSPALAGRFLTTAPPGKSPTRAFLEALHY